MNINDVEDLKELKEPAISFLLKRQAELAEKYKEIEGRPNSPMDIHTKETQIWVKDFFWRVTEELMEAREAWRRGEIVHYSEELSDALHFYLEVFFILDIDPNVSDDDILNYIRDYFDIIDDELDKLIMNIIYRLGLAGNHLRNKKWKQTQVFVDKQLFQAELIRGFWNLLTLIGTTVKLKDIMGFVNLYYRKFTVNQFRQRSKY